MSINKCNQHGCENTPAFRFTWPGRDEAAICKPHSEKLKAITAAMGLYVQLIELELSEEPHNE